jgi:hypothetical protein
MAQTPKQRKRRKLKKSIKKGRNPVDHFRAKPLADRRTSRTRGYR